MAAHDEVKKIVTRIQGDETLAMWARTSIRFNHGRENQAIDFMSKLKTHNITLIASVATMQKVLSQIDKLNKVEE